MKNLGELVHNGGYNVTSEILSFLSPAHLPVQITPTRWRSDRDKIKDLEANVKKLEHEIDTLKETVAQLVAPL